MLGFMYTSYNIFDVFVKILTGLEIFTCPQQRVVEVKQASYYAPHKSWRINTGIVELILQ